MEPAMTSLPSGGAIKVLRGDPTDDELAAVVIALDVIAGEARGDRGLSSSRPAWTAAARLESLGARPLASPAELQAARRPFD